ncbi:MAG TPA: methyltransferase domain-containing protein [Verrucomicrobiae bacterium]|nr:methyltransferase domain-containing protein [Verrucomicrobiae bacterium]
MSQIDPAEAQRITLESYNTHIDEYVDKKELLDHDRTAAYWPGVEYFLDQLPPGQTIFEVGSGSGADARRTEAAGFRVQRSDAAESFRDLLQAQGHDVLAYNVLDQPPEKTYKAILANAVLLHCNTDQFRQAVSNLYQGLQSQGLLCLGMKVGDFEGWREKGLSGKRYFKYWQIPDLEQELQNAGFAVGHSYLVSDGGFAVITATKRSSPF